MSKYGPLTAWPEHVSKKPRPRVSGKFIFIGEEKFYVRGVTYGPFRPEEDGSEYHTPEVVERDFALMKERGVNTVRTYTVPPHWLLDAARRHGLYVLVGLPWEQHITFLDNSEHIQAIETRVRKGVRACAGHPAVLGFTVGNEIPPSIVRWYGRRRIARFVERLYRVAKEEDPESLVTYVNYPTTEYLQHHLSFLDFMCFNVYLEAKETYEAYLARLQNLAGDKPLVMAEIGLDSHRNGLEGQARSLDWQIRSAFAAGCAGAFVFSWTDEWHRGGYDIEDWDFGLTDRNRAAKPALAAVQTAFAEAPFPPDLAWPRISVIICSYNGAPTIGETLEAVRHLDYPDYEVIVVSDGSTDRTAKIASDYNVRLIQTENQGLSAARNTGLDAATGEIVAYLDDDAYPDPHGLTYLAATFMSTDHVGVGGPNIAPPGDGVVADAVDHAPGNPTHVLLSDRVAEHIPGCNMAFRKDALQAIGGFDRRYRIAGDDVDVCWRLQANGGTLGFSPAAMVWHHRRRTVRTYWKQQKNYGKAEAILETRWPEKYNRAGHLRWQGQVYQGSRLSAFRRWRVYYGVWGTNLFQSIYAPAPGMFASLPLMPEWYLLILALGVLSVVGFFWPPLLVALLLLVLAVGALLFQAVRNTKEAFVENATGRDLLKVRLLTVLLHLLQPMARLLGRLSYGLTPWRPQGLPSSFVVPWPRTASVWSERWRAPEQWLTSVESILRAQGSEIVRGGDFDRWDLEVRGGLFGVVRLRMAIEEHGGGKQLARFRCWPRTPPAVFALVVLFTALSLAAAFDGAWAALALLVVINLALVGRILAEGSVAASAVLRALDVEEAKQAYGAVSPSHDTDALALPGEEGVTPDDVDVNGHAEPTRPERIKVETV